MLRSFAELETHLLVNNALREWVLQRYVPRPLLFEGRKFRLRAYVLAVGALKVYFWDDVLLLSAQRPYPVVTGGDENESADGGQNEEEDEEELYLDLSDRTALLTNTAVQSAGEDRTGFAFDEAACVHLLQPDLEAELVRNHYRRAEDEDGEGNEAHDGDANGGGGDGGDGDALRRRRRRQEQKKQQHSPGGARNQAGNQRRRSKRARARCHYQPSEASVAVARVTAAMHAVTAQLFAGYRGEVSVFQPLPNCFEHFGLDFMVDERLRVAPGGEPRPRLQADRRRAAGRRGPHARRLRHRGPRQRPRRFRAMSRARHQRRGSQRRAAASAERAR